MGRARALVVAALLVAAGPAAAWSNHALGTWPALAAMPALRGLPPVRVESLAAFIAGDCAGLAAVLAREEAWARAHVHAYPPRPDKLAFRAGPADCGIAQFVAATRINPDSRLALYLQTPPGAPGDRPPLAASAATTAEHSESSRLDRFVSLRPGEDVPVLDVVASASDEPDYGFDIGLWSDNGTTYGAAYGFGKQPFGNPKIVFASQAPMHMGFFHEAGIVYRAAPFLGRTFPEYRVHLWRSLAAEAFRSGHPYWGWRFAGWGLHYVQDLTQPYHARVMPGASALRMMWINALDLVGLHGPKTRAIALLSNRHLALESFEQHWLYDALAAGHDADPGLQALRGRPDEPRSPFGDDSLRDAVSRRAWDAADAIDAALVATLPARLVSDPDYVFGVTEPGLDVHALLARVDPAASASLQKATLPLLAQFGARSRDYVAAILAASPQARER